MKWADQVFSYSLVCAPLDELGSVRAIDLVVGVQRIVPAHLCLFVFFLLTDWNICVQ